MMCEVKKECPYFEPKCEDCVTACAKYKAYVAVQQPKNIEAKLKELGLNYNMDTWTVMIGMQIKLAENFHKIDNLTKQEKDHWIDRYLVCIDDEIRELREHLNIYNRKHYVKNNEKELKKEVIDILHFLMEVFIAGAGNEAAEIIKKHYLNQWDFIETDDLLKYAWETQKQNPPNFGECDKDLYILKLALKLQDACGLVRQEISWKHWKKAEREINTWNLYEAFVQMFKTFIDLAIATMEYEDIKKIYIEKNVENFFRQEFGY